MLKYRYSLLFFYLIFSVVTVAQDNGTFKFEFYNVENLFDTIDDPHKNDNEFLPTASRHWTENRYRHKLDQLSRVIVGSCHWTGPEFVGLAEVENRQVLEDLIRRPNMVKFGYGIIHYESPDRRGIDVAVLYKKSAMNIISAENIKVSDPTNVGFATRDILYVMIELNSKDTLHVYVNHWPSRRGGAVKSAFKRQLASNVLQKHMAEAKSSWPTAKFMVMGDFNDDPSDESLRRLALKADLKNLASAKEVQSEQGSLKYQGQWNYFDQILVSKSWQTSNSSSIGVYSTLTYFSPEWICTKDIQFGGIKPNRSFSGFNYVGGYSDHFPVVVELKIRK